MKAPKFYKLARPDGWDFHTGKTIQYRDNIGKTVSVKDTGTYRLCSETIIHASKNPNDCFIGAKIPCSAYKVQGIPFVSDKEKSGFIALKILEEIIDLDKLFGWNYTEAANPINPFKIDPPEEITAEHIQLLKKWASVRNSVRVPMGSSMWDSAQDSVWASVRKSVQSSAWASTWVPVWDFVWASVQGSVQGSVGDFVWIPVWNSVWASVRNSAWASVWAYIGSFFPGIEKWENINHKKGEYPFRAAADLWKLGLVPSHNGETWRLHGGANGEILWEGKI